MEVPSLLELQDQFGLTSKQARFVQELPASDWNASEAARRAGYSTPVRRGHENLQKEKIQVAVSAMTEVLTRKAEVRVQDLIEEYRRIAFSDITDAVSWDENGKVTVTPSAELPPEVTASIKKIKAKTKHFEDYTETRLEIEFHDKARAMDKLGQHLGLWKDPNEIRVQILQVFSEMTPEELARLESMDDEQVLELIEEHGVWRLPDGVGG